MPAKPVWLHRLDTILETRHRMESTHLDRLAVQKLFGVQERRARQLMAGLPGLKAGNASAVLRQALIERLEKTPSGGWFQCEVTRRARVVEALDRARRQLAARTIRIPAAADVEDRRLRDLSSAIVLKPGELRGEFYGAEDLAGKLLELSQAMMNDWADFARAVEDGGTAAAVPKSRS